LTIDKTESTRSLEPLHLIAFNLVGLTLESATDKYADWVTDGGWTHLQPLYKLKELHVVRAHRIRMSGLALLATLPQLSYVSFTGKQTTHAVCVSRKMFSCWCRRFATNRLQTD
jgi:hypothetical protein